MLHNFWDTVKVLIDAQVSKPWHLIEMRHLLEQWPRALCIYYCHLFWVYVNFTLCVNYQLLSTRLAKEIRNGLCWHELFGLVEMIYSWCMAGTVTTFCCWHAIYLRPIVYQNTGLGTPAFIRDLAFVWDQVFIRSLTACPFKHAHPTQNCQHENAWPSTCS